MYQTTLACLAAFIIQNWPMGEGRSTTALAAGSDAKKNTGKGPRYRRTKSRRHRGYGHAEQGRSVQEQSEESDTIPDIYGAEEREGEATVSDQSPMDQSPPQSRAF